MQIQHGAVVLWLEILVILLPQVTNQGTAVFVHGWQYLQEPPVENKLCVF